MLQRSAVPLASIFLRWTSRARTADLSEDGEISDSDDDNDLPSVKKILAHAKRVQPQTWPPESVIDLTGESDDNDTVVSLHRKHPSSSVSHKANTLPPDRLLLASRPISSSLSRPPHSTKIPLEEHPSLVTITL